MGWPCRWIKVAKRHRAKTNGQDGAVSASVASSTAAAPVPRAQVTAARIPVEAPVAVPATAHPRAIPFDLATIMAAAIEAALKPMKERLGATIVAMQRTIASLRVNRGSAGIRKRRCNEFERCCGRIADADRFGYVRPCCAALRGEVRIQSLQDVVAVDSLFRFAGAALAGEVRLAGVEA